MGSAGARQRPAARAGASVTAWNWIALTACIVVCSALWVDRSSQKARLEEWIAQTAELEIRLQSDPSQVVEPARELQNRVRSTPDRWIGSTQRALEARVRALVNEAEKQTGAQ